MTLKDLIDRLQQARSLVGGDAAVFIDQPKTEVEVVAVVAEYNDEVGNVVTLRGEQ